MLFTVATSHQRRNEKVQEEFTAFYCMKEKIGFYCIVYQTFIFYQKWYLQYSARKQCWQTNCLLSTQKLTQNGILLKFIFISLCFRRSYTFTFNQENIFCDTIKQLAFSSLLSFGCQIYKYSFINRSLMPTKIFNAFIFVQAHKKIETVAIFSCSIASFACSLFF